jgi:hypothetical protein
LYLCQSGAFQKKGKILPMDLPRLKRESWLYLLAFLVALALRLVRLGAFPLTDAEAAPALQALQIARGTAGAAGPNSAYVLLTGILFFLFESSNFFARFIPALAGSFLVFVPLLFRRKLSPRVSILLAFFLALDPGLLALSRQAGSSILGVTFLLFAWGFWMVGSRRLAAILVAIALLSGPAVWAGLLGLVLSVAISQSIQHPAPGGPGEDETEMKAVQPSPEPLSSVLRTVLPPFIAALVLFGTLLFLVPGGINGILGGLLEYVRSWGTSSSLPAWLLPVSLLFYQPLALILGLIGLGRGWIQGNRLVIPLSIWLLAALLLAVFRPDHQVEDLVWPLLPLLALAAFELSHHFDLHPEERVEVGGVILLTLLVLVFAWLDLASLPWNPGSTGQANLRLWLLFGALFLLVVSLLLVAVGWSSRTARLGAVWGAVIFLGLLTISSGLAASRVRANYTSELWSAGSHPAQGDLLSDTASKLSDWSTGQVDALPVTIYQYDSPALRWILRSHEITFVNTLDPASSPPIVITPYMENLGLSAAYRGQDFTWNQAPAWNSATVADWLRWVILREMPEKFDTIMLWARNDLFLDDSTQPAP